MRHRDSDYGAQAAGLLLALCYLIGNPPRTPGNGSAHPPLRTSTHPPTRGVVREWVSYEADPGGGLPARVPCDDCTEWMYCVSCWIRRSSGVGAVPRVARSGRWGLWVAARSAAAHSRDPVGITIRSQLLITIRSAHTRHGAPRHVLCSSPEVLSRVPDPVPLGAARFPPARRGSAVLVSNVWRS